MHDTTTTFLRPIRLWFGMVEAPVIWSVFLLVQWVVMEFGCRLDFGNSTLLSINSIDALVLLTAITAVTISLYSGFVAYQNWQQIEAIDAETRNRFTRGVLRGQFMAATGMIFSALFTLVTLYMTAPMFVLPPCLA